MPRCDPPGPEFITRFRSTRGLRSLGCSQVFGGMNTTPIVLAPGFWLDPDFDAVEKPMLSLEKLAAEENLDGLTKVQLETFRRRAFPEPGAALRGAAKLTNDKRLDLPSTVVCTGYTSAQYKDAVKEGQAWLGGLAGLRNGSDVDLPAGHWPMWSRPQEPAAHV